MNILVIGSGGREHALAWKLAQSKETGKILVAPGNGGTAGEAKCVNVSLGGRDPASEEGQEFLVRLAGTEKIDITIVGPEAPLAAGIAGRFREAGLRIIGPGKEAARLEASKGYAKSFMEKYGVRTAKSKTFTELDRACGYAGKSAMPLVIKADGLASGKGVVIAADYREAEECLSSFMKKKSLGDAGTRVVLEEFLRGREVSLLAAVSVGKGKKGAIKPFMAARDHKRRFDADRGPNTGGMGAVAPVPDFTVRAYRDFLSSILEPTLRGMEKEGMDYQGFIFFGLMVKDESCSLLEYNVRLGDPETQAVLPLMESDFSGLCTAILDGSLGSFPLKWNAGAVCAPVAVAGGYPGAYRRGDPIAVNPLGFGSAGAKLFIAGAERGPGGALGSGLRTAGGRVLSAAALGASAEEARIRAYEALGWVNFEGMDYRRDIGASPPAG
ncbi:MAG: phosphoribosylamine--glycine ligase [Treponema sp.]|jgi:phosphoribosylamine--glycine ligase|nr:phosphoribosylamine--glycine ligase [Treponema sp.]